MSGVAMTVPASRAASPFKERKVVGPTPGTSGLLGSVTRTAAHRYAMRIVRSWRPGGVRRPARSRREREKWCGRRTRNPRGRCRC